MRKHVRNVHEVLLCYLLLIFMIVKCKNKKIIVGDVVDKGEDEGRHIGVETQLDAKKYLEKMYDLYLSGKHEYT